VFYIIAKKIHIFSIFPIFISFFTVSFFLSFILSFFLSFSLSVYLFSYLPCLSFFPSPIFLHLCTYLLIQLTPAPCRLPVIWLGEQADGSSIVTLFLLSKSVRGFGFFLERCYQAKAYNCKRKKLCIQTNRNL